jgi:hypothetical protein
MAPKCNLNTFFSSRKLKGWETTPSYNIIKYPKPKKFLIRNISFVTSFLSHRYFSLFVLSREKSSEPKAGACPTTKELSCLSEERFVPLIQ